MVVLRRRGSARPNLAVLDRDRDAIVAAHGGEPGTAMLAARIVGDLEEATLHDDAVAYAQLGVAMDGRGWDLVGSTRATGTKPAQRPVVREPDSRSHPW